MEDSQNVDIVVWLNQIGYPVVTVENDPDFAQADELIPLPNPRMVLE